MNENKRKLIADTCQKFGLGFGLAAFVQADHPGEFVIYTTLAGVFLIAAIRFTPDGD